MAGGDGQGPGPGGAVASLAWSLHGTRLASGGRDGSVGVWDAVDGEQICVLEGHLAVAAADSGRSAVPAGRDRTLMAWDLDTCEAITTVRTGYPVRCCAITQDPEGLTIVAGDAGGQAGLLRLGSTKSSLTV